MSDSDPIRLRDCVWATQAQSRGFSYQGPNSRRAKRRPWDWKETAFQQPVEFTLEASLSIRLNRPRGSVQHQYPDRFGPVVVDHALPDRESSREDLCGLPSRYPIGYWHPRILSSCEMAFIVEQQKFGDTVLRWSISSGSSWAKV